VFYRQRDNLGRIGIDLPAVLRVRDNVDNLVLADVGLDFALCDRDHSAHIDRGIGC
jgi:hypothetical protein